MVLESNSLKAAEIAAYETLHGMPEGTVNTIKHNATGRQGSKMAGRAGSIASSKCSEVILHRKFHTIS